MGIPSNYTPIKGSERHPATNAKRVGPCDPGESVSATICLRRNPHAPPLPSQQRPATVPGSRPEHLTPEQFAATYGATQNDIDRVIQFARSFNLKIEEASAAKRTVIVSGTADDMSRAFAVELNRYDLPDHQYRGRDGFVHLPNDLANIVTGVLGLDNRRVVHHHATIVAPEAAPSAGSAGARPLTPPQVAKLYNFPTNPATGQTIGILEFGGGYVVDPATNRASDVDAFCASLGLTAPSVTAIALPGGANSLAGSKTNFNPDQDDDAEVALDLEIAAVVAQGAKIAVYFAPNNAAGFHNAVQTAVQDTVNRPDVLSISWGGSELNDWSSMDIDNISSAFEDAFNVGISVFVSSGDDGSDCGIGDGSAHVEYPGSDKWVVCCGGTIITNANVGSGTFNEGTWNDAGGGATGGGISDHFDSQPWQVDAGVPPSVNPGHRVGRGVPDVAGNASPLSGYDLWLYGTQFSKLVATTGPNAGGVGFIEGGTSAVAPLYAALAALMNASRGGRSPFLNAFLYGLKGTSALRPINDGHNNQWSGEAKPAPSYTSGPGWNACTGLGSIDGNALLAALPARMDAALIHPNGEAYFFCGNLYPRFDFTTPEHLDKVGVIGVTGWPGVWSDLDAALIHPLNGMAYFFKGNQYQAFRFAAPAAAEHVDHTGTIGVTGWPGVWSDLDAALIHPLNGMAYFFKGNQYQAFKFAATGAAEHVDHIGTIGASGWPGVWSDLDAALIHPLNGMAYFFKGNQYQAFKFAATGAAEHVDHSGTIGVTGWPGL